MADYNLEVAIEATTGRLQGGLRKAEGMMRKSAAKMRGSFGKLSGVAEFGKKAGKNFTGGLASAVGAAAIGSIITGALDGAVKQSNPETREAGKSMGMALFEGLLGGMERIPIAGQVGRLIGNALGAKDFEEQQLKRAEEAKVAQGIARRRRMAEEVERAHLAHVKAEQERIKKLEEERIAAAEQHAKEVAAFNRQQQRFADDLMEREMRAAAAGDDAAQRKITADRELYDARLEIEQRIRDLRENEQFLEAQQLERQKEAMLLRIKEVQAMEEAAIVAEKAREAEEDRLAIEKAKAEEQAKTQKAFLDARLKAEEEIAKARAEAESQVAGATSTFSTAGGSFTTAVSAQVNESKLLNRISEQSRDLLAQIVQNTAMMGGGFA
tara:strand:+ start:3443 stop:4591 length:1149 start_codon:yes stop_codon:yes gene_type:complete